MADDNDSGGITKLLIGGGLAYLAYQWLIVNGGAGAGLNGGCPVGYTPQTQSNGTIGCIPPGGGVALSPSQILGIATAGVGAAAGIASAVIPLVVHAAAAGAGAATATTAGATATTAVSTAATTGEAVEITADVAEAAADITATVAGGVMGFLILAFVLLESIEANIGAYNEKQITFSNTSPCPRLDGDQFCGMVLDQEQGQFYTFLSDLVNKMNAQIQANIGCSGNQAIPDSTGAFQCGTTPGVTTYVDMNSTVALNLSGFGSYAAGRRFAKRLSAFSRRIETFRRAGQKRASALSGFGQFGLVAQQVPVRPPPTASTQAIQALAVSLAPPSPSTPYGWTNLMYGGNCASSSYAYAATVDPRLPNGMLMDFRAMSRWQGWIHVRAFNAACYNYWAYRISTEGKGNMPITLSATQGAEVFACPPADFDTRTKAFYDGLPALPTSVNLFPPLAYQPMTDFASVQAEVVGYLNSLNTLLQAGGAPLLDPTVIAAQIAFTGTAGAVTSAGGIGFYGAYSTWPGDLQFTQMIQKACGLLSWNGPMNIGVVDPLYGGVTDPTNANFGKAAPTARIGIQDPATGYWLDVVGSREQGRMMAYQSVAYTPNASGVTLEPLSGFGAYVGAKKRGARVFTQLQPVHSPRLGLLGLLRKGLVG